VTVGSRIAVVGSPGAGKSTLSVELGRKLALPVIHIDQLAWQAGWVEVDRDELVRRQQAAFTRDSRWIADGNYGSTMRLRLAVADTIVFLDFPTRICLYRVVKRRIQYLGRTRPDMTDGCEEKMFDRSFLEFLRYVAGFRSKSRLHLLKRLEQLDGSQRVITLKTPRQVARFVASLG
jgi:adenylate kinase family enzyme